MYLRSDFIVPALDQARYDLDSAEGGLTHLVLLQELSDRLTAHV